MTNDLIDEWAFDAAWNKRTGTKLNASVARKLVADYEEERRKRMTKASDGDARCSDCPCRYGVHCRRDAR